MPAVVLLRRLKCLSQKKNAGWAVLSASALCKVFFSILDFGKRSRRVHVHGTVARLDIGEAKVKNSSGFAARVALEVKNVKHSIQNLVVHWQAVGRVWVPGVQLLQDSRGPDSRTSLDGFIVDRSWSSSSETRLPHARVRKRVVCSSVGQSKKAFLACLATDENNTKPLGFPRPSEKKVSHFLPSL